MPIKPTPLAVELRRLLPAIKWFKSHIYDAIPVGRTGEYAKKLAVAEHKARRGGMCFTITPDYEDGEESAFVQAYKPSDCGHNGPRDGARPVAGRSVNAPDTDDAAIRYAEAVAALDYFGDRPLRARRSR